MPIREMPKFNAVADKMLEIPQPAIGGLNLKDLEFEQEVNQSPYLLNVMYRNGAFGKRYGQEIYLTASDEIYDSVYFGGFVFIHAGTKIYRCSGSSQTEVGSGLPANKGLFVIFAQKLYYLISSGFYSYDNGLFAIADTYIPDFMINLKPDGSTGGDVIDDLNLIGNKANYIFNGEANVTEYNLSNYDSDPAVIDWDVIPVIEVDGTVTTAFTVDKVNKKITFTSAPGEGDMNVQMTFTLKSTVHSDEKAKILSCKFYDTFGGAQNSRLFLAGAGNSIYYWSQAFDLTYFPENNWARLGNTEDDITGFGRQYNVLIVFKPREVYSVYSYTETSSTTVIEENIGLESFRSQLVNPRVGCDAPYSIQLINNLLTWYNSNEGICTLVSTNVQDERNVRVISRNIERTNNFGVKGILDYDEAPSTIQSVDYNNKYFLVFPQSGMCFMWDYEISPYRYSSSGETNPRELDWYLFDNFYAKQFLKAGKQLLYTNGYSYSGTATATNIMKYGNFASVSRWTARNGTISVSNNKLTYTCTETGYNCYLYPSTAELDFEEGHSYLFMADIKSSRTTDDFRIRLYKSLSFDYASERVSLVSGETKRVACAIDVDQTGVNVGVYMYFSATFDNQMDVGDTVEVENYMLIDMTESFGSDFGAKTYALKNVSYIPYNSSVTFTYGQDFTKALTKLNSTFVDLDFDGDGEGDPIHCYYMTPFFQFGAVEYLKNIKNMYVQCRGDANTKIDIYYYTDDSSEAERDPESIMVGGGTSMWSSFSWESFGWFMNTWGNTFRRKCNIKKVQMASMYFENNEYSDMSITHIGLQYQLVKYVR